MVSKAAPSPMDVFYTTYGFRLNEESSIPKAIRVIEDQYEGIMFQVSLKLTDIEHLEDNNEPWATLFKYSSDNLPDHLYPQAFAALEKALAYFEVKGFPSTNNSPMQRILHALINRLNAGGLEAYLQDNILTPKFEHAHSGTLFTTLQFYSYSEADDTDDDESLDSDADSVASVNSSFKNR
jgi:hypothetical protein